MLYQVISFLRAGRWFFLGLLLASVQISGQAQTSFRMRVMAANITSGTGQSYETAGIDIFQGLKPDVVTIQEFRYNSSSSSNDLRSLVDTAFGTNYFFYCEPGYNIPNGIISRWPIIAAGSWDDTFVNDRGFGWAQIDLPGTNDLYVVSVHLYSGGTATDRGDEAAAVKSFIQSNFPTNAWVIVGGDFNTGSRGEAAVTTFKTFLSDTPIPDDNGNTPDADTNEPRNHPYDYLLPSFSLTNLLTPVVLPSHTLDNGLVFDSAIYAPLSDVVPVASGDSHVTGMQHMAIIKDFLVTDSGGPDTNAPSITTQPLDRTVPAGSNVLFSVTAAGAPSLSYQWYFNTNTLITGATGSILTVTNAQLTNAGGYSVIVTNSMGSVTSAVANLTVTNTGPVISTQPKNQAVSVGGDATFSVSATGTAPLSYQWFFNTNTLIIGATTNIYVLNHAQLTNAGSYLVIITNSVGSVTSLVTTLSVSVPSSIATNVVISQIYGGGGNAGATYKNDFVELFNPTANAVNVTGWSVQYSSDTGGSWLVANLSGTIQPYHYYLVQFAGGAVGGPLPAPDTTTTVANISATHAKVALVNTTTALTGTNPLGASQIIDFVGFGSTASAFEGSAPAPGAPSSNNTTSTVRKNGGFTDAKDNANDFTTLTPPSPRNSATPANPPPPPPLPTLTSPIYSPNFFVFTVTGTTGSNYIIQVSTNLNANNWIPLFTNTSPFTFTNLNASDFPQGFYRAVAAP